MEQIQENICLNVLCLLGYPHAKFNGSTYTVLPLYGYLTHRTPPYNRAAPQKSGLTMVKQN